MEAPSQETQDAELFAKSALLFSQSVEVLAANQARESAGLAPAYDGLYSELPSEIENELKERLKYRQINERK